ncbi:YihY/virulence factor BrkB family protein [bacterium SCSIO 12643]|nr:YihY/virulence factor BrkB family protein [bacterium SCSIO 12643]
MFFKILSNLKNKLYQITFIRKLVFFVKHVKIPFFGGLEIYKVGIFFIRGLAGGFLTTRAAAIAFNFFLAIFPSIIFIFSLIPFIPIDGFQEELQAELLFAAPKIMDTFLEDTLFDIIKNKHTSLLSLGFILAMYFATNGINSLLTAFVMSYHTEEHHARSWFSQQITAIMLTIFLTIFLFIAIFLTIFGGQIIQFVFDTILDFSRFDILLINLARWIIIIAFIYFSVAFIYFYGPKQKVQFFSPGASLATIAVILFTLGFAFYIDNFASYNKLYGSIGTVMGIMLMIYLNSLALLIGYELNAAIEHGSTHIRLEEYE